VSAFRLLGYENRMLAAHEFNDDRKDAGDVGAGHTVTALYELIPASRPERAHERRVDDLKYQTSRSLSEAAASDELMTIKLRYKEPDSEASQLQTWSFPAADQPFAHASNDFRFAASVAAFGMLLRRSAHCGDANLETVRETAISTTGADSSGYRREFVQLVEMAQQLAVPNN
jgi:Ca-activated chloride channel family protein